MFKIRDIRRWCLLLDRKEDMINVNKCVCESVKGSSEDKASPHVNGRHDEYLLVPQEMYIRRAGAERVHARHFGQACGLSRTSAASCVRTVSREIHHLAVYTVDGTLGSISYSMSRIPRHWVECGRISATSFACRPKHGIRCSSSISCKTQ